jgi:hypothetical protein
MNRQANENENENELWFHLCQLAAVEPDPEKLLRLMAEVNFLLSAKEDSLAASRRTRRAQ